MKKYTQEEINGILELHKKWLKNEDNGQRANFSWADLSGADLSGANLFKADLFEANLSRADLSRADLYEVIFDDIILTINTNKYIIQIKGKKWIKVGCKEYSLEEWLNFSQEEIKDMAYDDLEFYPILINYLKATFR